MARDVPRPLSHFHQRGVTDERAHDVSTTAGGEAIVGTALEHFGRIDVVVNNAGIIRWGGLPELDLENLERHLAVHLLGSFTTMRAAWPHFIEQGYGRIVLTTSSGLFGLDNNLSYAAAKAGVIGLARGAKLAGEPHGIKVNLIAPAAQTRMAGGDPLGDDAQAVPGQPFMPSDAVAPMVAFLAHESCPVNGEIYTAGAGRFARVFIASTEGYAHQDGAATIEDVAKNWDAVNDESGVLRPRGPDGLVRRLPQTPVHAGRLNAGRGGAARRGGGGGGRGRGPTSARARRGRLGACGKP
ncbi:SDR family NAD(P)-dependent oxidoreductase [Amycolatopsis mediterranei]|uniref:SDR family NAD(P)-dependent oxidoreductase n=1 Tax=Amycolatopsis mediterranei TaxID=33910 RepID=UPI00222ECAB2|nr:SDR family NAD(P)-dependent oxidoreductase [Amycolatopsis mediterranei]UZF76295.1 SDR family NAD(P)-dependent oxidoreductase [Amycolatopsis mediterranei]